LETVSGQADQPDASDPIWVPPILRTVALDGAGIPGLAGAIADHRAYLQRTGGWEQRERWRLQTELDMLLQNRLVAGFRSRLTAGVYEQVLAELLERRISPFQAVEKLVNGAS
jgi:LAO/AO transport system kinase